ncbi:dTDP-4-dehydrorhamnose reductase [Castellaniella daejeonensis]|jgi:dTDP-4-dehydrorhamnose reductase|uniref:dTDP-4-dehydrorhamnose reductase n=1 Tax=Castellaniella daejeonensis TaxID=659013 RepID=A0ABP3D5F9_9BURK|nr:dTDP-4-dehydrorhamnose reductase [Castellaniella sp.]HET8702597.1 dTDP-4-dehydrorhamnose reductase [Castellaniella sp.]
MNAPGCRTDAPLRILVTGADGQLGRSLRALARQRPGEARYEFLSRPQLDITQPDAVAAWLDAHPADRLINAAAYTAVDRAAAERDPAHAINAAAPGVLARACAARGIRLLHVSTDYVFDGRLGRPYREEDATAPLNAYGRDKLEGEQAVLAAAPQALVVRTGWVFSAWGHNFVRTMVRLGGQHETLRVIDDQIGGPTWAGHLAQVLHALALRPAGDTPGGVYHFGGHPWISWHGFAREILARAHALGLIARLPSVEAIASAEWPSPEPRPANGRLDCTRLETLLGPLARDWRIGLDQVLKAWKTAGA